MAHELAGGVAAVIDLHAIGATLDVCRLAGCAGGGAERGAEVGAGDVQCASV